MIIHYMFVCVFRTGTMKPAGGVAFLEREPGDQRDLGALLAQRGLLYYVILYSSNPITLLYYYHYCYTSSNSSSSRGVLYYTISCYSISHGWL